MKRASDIFIKIFTTIYSVFLYSLIVPLFFGLLLVVVMPIVQQVYLWQVKIGWYQYIIYILIGIIIKIVRERNLKE